MKLIIDLPLSESFDLEVIEINSLLSLGLSPSSCVLSHPLFDRLLLFLLDPLHGLHLPLLSYYVLEVMNNKQV